MELGSDLENKKRQSGEQSHQPTCCRAWSWLGSCSKKQLHGQPRAPDVGIPHNTAACLLPASPSPSPRAAIFACFLLAAVGQLVLPHRFPALPPSLGGSGLADVSELLFVWLVWHLRRWVGRSFLSKGVLTRSAIFQVFGKPSRKQKVLCLQLCGLQSPKHRLFARQEKNPICF